MNIAFSHNKYRNKLFQCYNDNNGLLISLPDENLESLITKAKELEKKYEWLQAAELYQKSVEFASIEKDLLKAAELQKKFGFCFYKAAFQSHSNIEYRKRMQQATQAYQKEIELLEELNEENHKIRSNHANAMVFFTQSLIETDPSQKKHLLDKWWNLENQVLEAYEQIGDMYSVGKTCNNLIENSTLWHDRFTLVSSHSEFSAIYRECIALAEKAIAIFLKFDDDFELTRAYCFASMYYIISNWVFVDKEKLEQLNKKTQNHSNKALELAQQINNAWLIGWSALAVSFANSRMVIPNPILEMEFCNKTIEYGRTTRDNLLIGTGIASKSWLILNRAWIEEDPNIQKEYVKKSLRLSRDAGKNYHIINSTPGICNSFHFFCWALQNLAEYETNPRTKKAILERIMNIIEGERGRFQGWKFWYDRIAVTLSNVLWQLAVISDEIEEKRELLKKAQFVTKQSLKYLQKMSKATFTFFADHYSKLAMIQKELANTETCQSEKINSLNEANALIETSIEFMNRTPKLQFTTSSYLGFGQYYHQLATIQKHLFSITKDHESLQKALEAYKQASANFSTAELPTYMAESYWQLAQLLDQAGEFEEASKYYESTSQAYDLSSKKFPQLKNFYGEHSLYMQAWNQIEQAKYFHSIEDYETAQQHYEEAANLHKSTSSWSYLASNYFAWAYLEEAEGFSRKENIQQAASTFKKAYQEFSKAQESIQHKIAEITSADEKEIIQNLFKASEVRRKYCQARILMEEAKLLDTEGKYQQSSRNYRKAAQEISNFVDEVNQAERKELEYLAILCQAWEKMANAEETASAESYLEAAELFEEAKDYCYTSKASLWALGNSNFCRGLAAGANYQTSLDLGEHAKAKSFMKNASTHYKKAGFKAASEYVKATQRLFDAYLFMNQAESEADQEKRAKYYQMAENLLQIAAGSFMKAKQPEKTTQVQGILSNVREEKALAISLTRVMQAPTIATSTSSFAAPTPTSEASVGLEKFEHANVQANLVTTLKEVKVGESFCLSVEFVNAGREPALLLRVEDFVPKDFVVVKKPEIYRIEESCLNMKGKQIAPLKLVEVKLTVQPSKKGQYQLNPLVRYLDERGQTKSLQLKTLEIKVKEVILENRISTGTEELDSLLLGGIPEEYAVVLSGAPCDEREIIVKNFLKAGAEEGIIFYVSTEATGLDCLLENPNFFLFLCNPKPKNEVPNLSNVFKLQGKTDLNNLGIALTKAYRSLDQNLAQPKRVCIEILSEVLEDYGSKTTRKWISDLITNYGAKGFTMLAVINSRMHSSEELYAVLDLFDGEISITQSDDPLDCKKSILIKKLRNQDYIKNPICLR
jgi:tetratricopeptide (TPR) repeat protein/KaiC/GvpD/RAD55 family RecA-like ATPase